MKNLLLGVVLCAGLLVVGCEPPKPAAPAKTTPAATGTPAPATSGATK